MTTKPATNEEVFAQIRQWAEEGLPISPVNALDLFDALATARADALEEAQARVAAIKDRSDVSWDEWTLTLVDAAIRALKEKTP
jgi:hypothetical protein